MRILGRIFKYKNCEFKALQYATWNKRIMPHDFILCRLIKGTLDRELITYEKGDEITFTVSVIQKRLKPKGKKGATDGRKRKDNYHVRFTKRNIQRGV